MNAVASKTSQFTNLASSKTLDPINVTTHTLSNGLKIFMSLNKNEPRIYTHIAVRAGSKQDPAETTGLAHYLEHMMFKGTSQIGSLNWEREKVLLTQIADLYETYRQETDPSVRAAIYAQIDSISNEAAQYVAANEYDKLVSSLGAKGTNAYTSNEQTVYVNDIPSNELKRWFQLESERFQMVTLRLFHTELETVYEEFNIGQDTDGRKVYQAMMESLFPTHPYGTQMTIGKGEHLKNPSHYNIYNYFKTYYVPNNMAIILSGDFDPQEVIFMAETYFGSKPTNTIPPFKFEKQLPLSKIVRKNVHGQQSEMVQLAWRLDGAQSRDAELAGMISVMLFNQQAGLMDLDLIQKQMVLEASAGVMNLTDYAAMVMSGRPREGQTLEAVEKLLVEQMERIKKGDFPDWLMQAVIKDYKYSQIKSYENNQNRAQALTDAFIKGIEWNDYIMRIERMKTLTKAEIVAFAQENFKDNYVVIYKRIGEDGKVMKVEKPPITPVSLNRQDASAFAQSFLSTESPRLKPAFLDFEEAIKTTHLSNGLPLDYIKNTTNETFSLYYALEMGRNADRVLSLAMSYLPFLGTQKFSAAELQQEFYKLGVSFDVLSNEDRSYVVLTGLEESFTEGVQLFEHILNDVVGDEEKLKNLVEDILSKRENNKKDKRVILRNAMASYAKYGKKSPFIDALSKETLENLTADVLVEKIKTLSCYEHRVFYYGTKQLSEVSQILEKEHVIPQKLTPVLRAKNYLELPTETDKVFFVHYPMVQNEILMLSKGTPQYSLKENIMATFFNTYFGSGLSSIVFQEIRESRALAYSANTVYSSPSKLNQAHYLQAYVGTQPDKIKDALHAMREILDNMPISETQIEHARQSVLKAIETERITKANVYWSYRSNLDKGIDFDIRKPIYDAIHDLTVQDLKDFHQKHVKGRNYSILILGDRDRVDASFLQTLGAFEELSLEEIFGY
jgi:zinc protease